MVLIYITPKHADMIYSGKKKSIVMKRASKSYLSNDLILVTKKKGIGFALGKIKLTRPKIIDSMMFLKLEQQHLLTQQEKKERFPGAKKFYSYNIQSFQKFEKPKIISLKPNSQNLSNISFNGDFSENLESYYPITQTKKTLMDDFRIVSGWHSSIKQGRKVQASKEQIFNIASKIYFELKRRGIFIKDNKFSKELLSGIKKDYKKSLPLYRKSDGKNYNAVQKENARDIKNIIFKIADFKKSDKTVLSSEVKFPYRFKTVAFSEGTWHETEYPWDVIKEGASKIVGSSLVTFHVGDNDTILTEVGHITDFELDENAKQLIVDCEVFDTSAGKDIAVLHANKRIPAVSVRLTEDSEMGVCKKIIAWPHVAIVREGEVSDAKPIYDND